MFFFISQCKMLTKLNLSYCTRVTDVSGLGQCKMLTELDLSGNPLSGDGEIAALVVPGLRRLSRKQV